MTGNGVVPCPWQNCPQAGPMRVANDKIPPRRSLGTPAYSRAGEPLGNAQAATDEVSVPPIRNG